MCATPHHQTHKSHHKSYDIIAGKESKIKCKIAKGQCGFVEDEQTRNVIFMLRMLGERVVEVKRVLFVWFLNHTKAFDKVRDKGILEMLQNLDIYGKDIQSIQNLYWVQTTAIRIDNEASSKILNGVALRLCVSPNHSICMEKTSWRDRMTTLE